MLMTHDYRFLFFFAMLKQRISMNFRVPHLASEIFASSDSVSEDGAGETLTSNRHKEQLKKSSNQSANSHGTNEINWWIPTLKKENNVIFPTSFGWVWYAWHKIVLYIYIYIICLKYMFCYLVLKWYMSRRTGCTLKQLRVNSHH